MHGFVKPAFPDMSAFEKWVSVSSQTHLMGSSITEKDFLPGLYLHEGSPAETNPNLPTCGWPSGPM